MAYLQFSTKVQLYTVRNCLKLQILLDKVNLMYKCPMIYTVGKSRGADGGRLTTKESRGDETVRP